MAPVRQIIAELETVFPSIFKYYGIALLYGKNQKLGISFGKGNKNGKKAVCDRLFPFSRPCTPLLAYDDRFHPDSR